MRLLAELEEAGRSADRIPLCRQLLADCTDGRIKMFVTQRALGLRRRHPQLFQLGRYLPLYGAVEKQEHVCGFAREHRREMAVAAAPRLAYSLMQGELAPPLGERWGNAELALPPHSPEFFENVFTGERLRMTPQRSLLCREVFAHFPLALLLGC